MREGEGRGGEGRGGEGRGGEERGGREGGMDESGEWNEFIITRHTQHTINTHAIIIIHTYIHTHTYIYIHVNVCHLLYYMYVVCDGYIHIVFSNCMFSCLCCHK